MISLSSQTDKHCVEINQSVKLNFRWTVMFCYWFNRSPLRVEIHFNPLKCTRRISSHHFQFIQELNSVWFRNEYRLKTNGSNYTMVVTTMVILYKNIKNLLIKNNDLRYMRKYYGQCRFTDDCRDMVVGQGIGSRWISKPHILRFWNLI